MNNNCYTSPVYQNYWSFWLPVGCCESGSPVVTSEVWSGIAELEGARGGTCPSISLPQLPLKNPYNNLKRRSLEKKLTCFVCGFVLTFLSFYSTQNSFVLLCRGPMSFNDIRMEYLILQPDVFKILMDREKLEYFSDILKVIKNVNSADTSMISEMI